MQGRDLPRYLTGSAAAVLSCYCLIAGRFEPHVFIASVFFIFACVYDTLWAKIPNFVNASLAIAGLALFFYRDGYPGILVGMAGLALGVALLLIPWLMGGMGAGDVKALGALGALLGPLQLLHVFVYMGLIGGVMAVLHYAFQKNLYAKTCEWVTTIKTTVLTNDPRMIIPEKTEVSRFPYAAAIAFGYYAYLHFGGIFQSSP